MAMAMAAWEWMTDSHQWKPYSAGISSTIEAAFQAHLPSLDVCIAAGHPAAVNTHSITFQTQPACQINWSTRNSRPVRRNVDPQTGTVEWQWWEGAWRSYDVTINAQIEMAWGQCQSSSNSYLQAAAPGGVSVRINHQKYVVEFDADAVQRNISTQFTRKVRRRLVSPGTSVGAAGASPSSVSLPQSVPSPSVAAGTGSLSYDANDMQPFVDTSDDDCAICVMSLRERSSVIMLSKCRHVFCKDCIMKWFETRPTCPVCMTAYGVITGNQPNGTMTVRIIPAGSPEFANGLEGFPNVDVIQIHYNFPSGIQGPEHPSPGRRYTGTKRVAYLPFTKEGEDVLSLLKTAWDRRLLFSVGTSITTGLSDVVTWSGVHHKTSTWGGPTNFGYPDVTYFARVKAELAEKGVR